MALIFSVPGKTFIAGEYLALSGQGALVFASNPAFELHVEKSIEPELPPWHPESPAGALLRRHPEYFSQFSIQFRDAYESRGGFGASTAQFLSVYALWMMQKQTSQDAQLFSDYRHLLEQYEECAWNGQGQKPSGADLVGQLKGSFTFFERQQGLISMMSWPFSRLDLLFFHTGQKLATHEHLKNLGTFRTDGLLKSFRKIKESFEKGSEESFITGVQGYASELEDLAFTCQPTLDLLAQFRKIPGVLAAKGCGALGADVILVVSEKSQNYEVLAAAEKLNLSCQTTGDLVSSGLQIKGSLS